MWGDSARGDDLPAVRTGGSSRRFGDHRLRSTEHRERSRAAFALIGVAATRDDVASVWGWSFHCALVASCCRSAGLAGSVAVAPEAALRALGSPTRSTSSVPPAASKCGLRALRSRTMGTWMAHHGRFDREVWARGTPDLRHRSRTWGAGIAHLGHFDGPVCGLEAAPMGLGTPLRDLSNDRCWQGAPDYRGPGAGIGG